MTCTYSLDPMIRYNPVQEWHVLPESQEGLALIRKCLSFYHDFSRDYRHVLNLNNKDSIELTYAAALEAGLFELAATARQTFFGRDMHFYGVTYLWDMCIESCVYCPAGLGNRHRTKYKPLALSVDQAVKDVQYVMKDGHRHICVLASEDPVRYPPKVVAEYIRAFDQLGLKEIILNVEPPKEWQDFVLWREAARHTALQFRVFQETYNRDKYTEIHPITKYGRKHNYDHRYQSQAQALAYGFDNVGLGVLFGNHALAIEEIDSLQKHAWELKEKMGRYPARICLPSAKYLATIKVDIPFSLLPSENQEQHDDNLYKKFSKLIYALARLAMPMISMVSSERDEENLLTELDNYATCTTLNVHPGVGDNIRFHENKQDDKLHFEQAPSFSRDPRSIITNLASRGYTPWLMIN
jgi:2-iminoacetate synthase